jgi:uncharacterized membrane protein YqiK
MTGQETWQAAVDGQRVRDIPQLVETMTAHQQAMTALEQLPYVESEKRRRRAEAESALHAMVRGLIDAEKRRRLKPLDDEEGALRRAAQRHGANATDADVRQQVARQHRAMLLATQAEKASTVADVRRAYAEAELMADDDVVRTTGLAALSRLRQLAEADRSKDVSQLRDALVKFDLTFTTWQQAHPSPTQRIEQIERVRDIEAQPFDASARFAMDLFGVPPAAVGPTLKPLPEGVEPAPDRLVFGRFWDTAAASSK